MGLVSPGDLVISRRPSMSVIFAAHSNSISLVSIYDIKALSNIHGLRF